MNTWTERTIGEISAESQGLIRTGPFGSQLHQSDYSQNGIPVIMPKNIINNKINTENIARVSTYHVERLSQHKLSEGDIVFGRRGDIGRQALIGKKQAGWLCGTGCIKISLGASIVTPLFLHYYLQQPEIINWIYNQAVGATIANLNTSIIKSIPIRYPGIHNQKKISFILTAYDDLIENNLRRIKILEEMAQALYREWFVHFRFPGHEKVRFVDSPLGKIPEGWKVKKLNQLISFQNKTIEAGPHLENRIYLPIDCLPRKSLAIKETRPWKEARSSLHLFSEKEIIFGAMRPYFHKVVVAPCQGVTRKTCFVFKSIEKEYHAFNVFTLFLDSTVAYADAHSKGATIPYAVWPMGMEEMPVITPPSIVARKYEGIVGPMIEEILNVFFRNKNLKSTRDLLLPKLISGELDVSELDIDVSDVS